MTIPITPPAPSPEHLAQMDIARQATKKIRRAVAFANFDGWTIAAFAAITIVFSITSPSGLLLGLGMTYIAWRELSCGAALRRLDITAPRKLAVNQLVLSGILILYFAWCLYRALTAPSEISELVASNPDAADMVGNLEPLARSISIWVYVGLVFGTILFQGLTARYYYTRSGVLEVYVNATPQWIIDYQRGGGTL